MTTPTDHAIAAFIASHTPIATRYAFFTVPGTELTDTEPLYAACPLCDGTDHTLAQCATWHAETGAPLIASLRAELASAHELIGQSIAAMEAADAAMHKLATRLGDKGLYGYPCDLQGGENPAAFQGLHATINAARAWLRKEAGR